MGARTFEDLIAWQLARQLRVEVFRLTTTGSLARDLRLRSQLDNAVGSVCRNIAEGFGRRSHAEFDRFLVMARASLNEVLDCLVESADHGHVTAVETDPIRALACRTDIALARLSASLRARPDPPWNARRSRH